MIMLHVISKVKIINERFHFFNSHHYKNKPAYINLIKVNIVTRVIFKIYTFAVVSFNIFSK